MVTGRHTVFSCAANFLRGRKYIFCGSFQVLHTQRGYVKCGRCGKSLWRLRRELRILQGFYPWQPAYRLSQDLGLDVNVVPRIYHRLREALSHVTELEAGKLKGESELDEAYCGGKRKGLRGRATAGKSVVFGLLAREGRVYTKVVESVSADELLQHIQAHTRKGSVYFTDAFRGDQSLKRYGHHHTVNHAIGEYVRDQAHTNGIESFWSMLKRAYKGTFHKMSPKHLQRYISEFAGKHNIREQDTLAQMAGMALGLAGKRLKYRHLIADNGLSSGARS